MVEAHCLLNTLEYQLINGINWSACEPWTYKNASVHALAFVSDQTFWTACKIWACTSLLAAITPKFSPSVRPNPKSKGWPLESVTIPPASSTRIWPGAWSYKAQIYFHKCIHRGCRKNLPRSFQDIPHLLAYGGKPLPLLWQGSSTSLGYPREWEVAWYWVK